MADSKLVINGREFPLHYRVLASIAESLPTDKAYADMAKALAGLNVPSITQQIIEKDLLPVEEMDRIWDLGDRELRRALADDDAFRKNLTDAQAREIIEQDDREILKDIARWAEQLYPDEGEEQAMRLSGAMADELLEHIRGHKDISVRRALAENSSTPLKFKDNFRECLEAGFEVGSGTLEKMTADDLSLLPRCQRDTLKHIANYIEDIKDSKVRMKVAEFLCAYPDPEVRLELAENFSAPASIRRMLLSDSEPDVAHAAERSLDDDD